MSFGKVAVGLSGGVDSSVSALLLKEQGFEVIGMFMKNWEDDELCPAVQDYEDALLAAAKIGIPLYTFNFAKEYWDLVFTNFLEDLRKGFTPNPDVFCNREIKFDLLLHRAFELGCEKLATGHYASISQDLQLLKGDDPNKDQSYFLHAIKANVLEHTLFPVGELPKESVRRIAKERGLPNWDKKDSTGICFIGKRNFQEFITKYIAPKPGVFQTPEGKVVGEHQGAWYYTIGQRKGMGIGGPGEGWFVVDKDIQSQVVTVVSGDDHPLLYSSTLTASDLTWISSKAPTLPLSCMAKVRYRQQDQPCIIEKIEDGLAHVRFNTPQRAVTPRQSVVFYQGKICLGGGLILNSGC